MPEWVTLSERKAARVAEMRRALESLRARLTEYARAHGGRFLLYGSAARDALRYDSDVDLLVDFPSDTMDDAWRQAEEECWNLNLSPDIMPLAWCREEFVARVAPETQVLG